MLKIRTTRYKMYNTIFKNCVAYESNGGAMFLNNIDRMEISNLSLSNNYALKNGGGLYF